MQIKSALERGDPTALELLWDAHAAELLACAQSILCSRPDAEDALHELFLRIVKSRFAVAKAENMRAYLFRMMRNLALETLKRRGRTSPLEEERESGGLILAVETGNESLKGDLEAAMKSLPEEQRAVVALRVYNDMQFNEIADALKIPQNTAASRFRYAMAKLREFLKT